LGQGLKKPSHLTTTYELVEQKTLELMDQRLGAGTTAGFHGCAGFMLKTCV